MTGTPPRPLLRVALLLVLASTTSLLAPAGARAASRPIVAVIDSGVDLRHPALRSHVWRNPAERAGNRVDDDGNGFVDDIQGADFIDRDGSPTDPRGHGTHVAGLIARRGGARIMALRVIGNDGSGPPSALAEAIHYAVDHGARVINLSVAYYGAAPQLEAALERAAEAGVIVVAAAGNGKENLDRTPIYPASFRTATMIVVAAAFGPTLESWSARGARSVDIAAPGTGLRSTLPRGRYGRKSGTSQATAVVTRGVVRVMRARPSAGARAVRRALLAGARRSPQLEGSVGSGGRLDVARAIARL